jgi:hypothetical protein
MAPLRFYAAGKAIGGEGTVQSVSTLLTNRGWQCALDWTTVIVHKPYLDHLTANQSAAQAMKEAVASSDLVVLVPEANVFEALVEAGIAIAFGAQVAVLGAARQSIFWCLPDVHLVDGLDELALLADEIEDRRRPKERRRTSGRSEPRGNLRVYRGPDEPEPSR